MGNNENGYGARVDEFLWKDLYKDLHECSDETASRAFSDRWGSGIDAHVLHEDLRGQYAAYIDRDPKAAFAFLESHPQMQGVHGEWRRMQQGYEPVSPYDLNSELEVSRFLSKYDPDLSISDMVTLFPEEIHNINMESFLDVNRRYGRDFFRENESYATGNDAVDEMFAMYDEECIEAAMKRMEDLAEQLDLEDPEAFDDDEEYDDFSSKSDDGYVPF